MLNFGLGWPSPLIMIVSFSVQIKKLCDQIDEKETAISNAKEALHRAEKIKYEVSIFIAIG